jgi:hypothetical protein
MFPVHARSFGLVYAVDLYRQKHTWSAQDIRNINIYAGPAVLDSDNWITELQNLAVDI